MGKRATGSSGEARELVPARTYRAVIIGVYDIGTQPGYGDNGPTPKFVIEYELHTRKGPARDTQGRAFTICKFVSFYLGSPTRKSDLLKICEAVEGRAFTAEEIKAGHDAEALLGKAVQVTVGHKAGTDKPKAIVEAVMALDPDDDAPTPEGTPRYFEITPEVVKAGRVSIPDWLPEFVREYAGASQEFGGDMSHGKGPGPAVPVGAGAAIDPDDPDCPF